MLTGAKAKGLAPKGDALLVETADGKDVSLPADKILVTVGRKPLTEGWGLEELELDMAAVHPHRRPVPHLDARRLCHRRRDRRADAGAPRHGAGRDGGRDRRRRKRAGTSAPSRRSASPIPRSSSVGLSPEEAQGAGREVKTGLFPFPANGRAMTHAGEDGFVRVVARADNHLVLGIQAVGQGVSELSAAFALAIEMGARLEDIAGTIHAHPTRSEAFQEAALKALGHALHI